MAGPSLLQSAVDELYASPLPEFTARRKALAAQARKNGDREAAGLIAGLRKPTLSADTLNRLVRTAPEEVEELLELGTELRAAEKSLDGAALRELSTRRKLLVSELARLAFDITEQPTPSASTRDEVTSTLNAALADEQVADLLMSGALVTQARWDGFGSTTLPELAAVLPLVRRPLRLPDERPRTRQGPSTRQNEPSASTAAHTAEINQKAEIEQRAATERAAAKARAELETQRRLDAAQREADEATSAATAASNEVAAIDRRISELSLQIAHQRELLAQAQRVSRSAEIRRRAAQLALTRAGGRLPG